MKDLQRYNEELRSQRRWMPQEAQPESQRAAIHRLAEAMRETIEALMDSDASAEELNEVAGLVEEVAQRLESGPRGRALWGFAETSNSGDAAAGFDNSPLVGPGNPIAPPLYLRVENDRVVGTAFYGRQYEGPPDHVHGGIISASFDELLGMVQSLTGSPGMTGRLTVHYRSPTPLHTELCFEGWLEGVSGRKISTRGTLHAGEVLCAESEGLFISMDVGRFAAMKEERDERLRVVGESGDGSDR